MKKGFTLVEVLVVIVILGILAAVGSPKLFGSIAKAKASEVPVAAGTYAKLQDAFLAEKSTPGNWKSIGYVAPSNGNSTNFCYSQGTLTNDTATVEEMSSGIIGWGATNLVSLNECGVGSWWSLVMTPNGNNGVNYAQNLSYAPCVALTSNWVEGRTLVGGCENATTVPTGNDTPIVSEKPTEEPTDPGASSASKDNQSSQSASNEPQQEITYVDCGKNGHATDERCCKGNNKTDCNCGTDQMKQLGLACK